MLDNSRDASYRRDRNKLYIQFPMGITHSRGRERGRGRTAHSRGRERWRGIVINNIFNFQWDLLTRVDASDGEDWELLTRVDASEGDYVICNQIYFSSVEIFYAVASGENSVARQNGLTFIDYKTWQS
jgi:hypothetical protein